MFPFERIKCNFCERIVDLAANENAEIEMDSTIRMVLVKNILRVKVFTKCIFVNVEIGFT